VLFYRSHFGECKIIYMILGPMAKASFCNSFVRLTLDGSQAIF
jgi:hypothetical protein